MTYFPHQAGHFWVGSHVGYEVVGCNFVGCKDDSCRVKRKNHGRYYCLAVAS